MNILPTSDNLISALLDYADDIVSLDRQEILDFFNDNGICYYNEHIDFLEKFGGSRTKFFDSINLNCAFQ